MAHTFTAVDDSKNLEDTVARIGACLQAAQGDLANGRLAEAMAGFHRGEIMCAEPALSRGLIAASAIQGQAQVLLDQGSAQEALEECGRALARLGLPGGPVDHEPTRAGLLTTTGLCLRTLGRYKTADEAYQMAIAHAEKEPGEILAIALGNYGALWSILGDPRHALALYEEALRVLDRYAAGSEQRAWILRNLGGALQDTDQIVAALSALEQALAAEEHRGYRRGETQVLLALSDCHEKATELRSARDYAERALAIVTTDAPRSELHARCLRQLSELTAVDDLPHALNAICEAASIMSEIAPDSRDSIDIGCVLSALQCGAGHIDEGIKVARSAHEAAERLRLSAPPGMARQTITAVSGRAADVYAATLMFRADGGPDARAFVDVLERRQARRLVDGLGSTAALDLDAQSEIRRLRRERREPGRVLQHAHWALQAAEAGQPIQMPSEEVRRAAARARQIIHSLDAAIDQRMSTISPVDPLRCEEIRQRLDAGQCLLHCLAAPLGCAVATMTSTSLRIRKISDTYAALEVGIGLVVAGIRAQGRADDQTLRGLSNMLLSDIPEDAVEVIVISDGPLHRLPWAVLRDPHDDVPIGVRRRMSHAASATAWLMARDRPVVTVETDLLLVGDPAYVDRQFPDVRHQQLPGSVREIETIRDYAADKATILMSTQATEANVMKELTRHRRAHIACHGLVDPDDARYSGLILAMPQNGDDGHDDLLQVWEIAELELPCSTIVLASCSAATGDVVRGEGMVGLVHALQYAGARQVLASLWPISDNVAPDILIDLYKHLEDGCSLDEGMRRTRSDFRHENPAHWACWAVYGPGAGTSATPTPSLGGRR